MTDITDEDVVRLCDILRTGMEQPYRYLKADHKAADMLEALAAKLAEVEAELTVARSAHDADQKAYLSAFNRAEAAEAKLAEVTAENHAILGDYRTQYKRAEAAEARVAALTEENERLRLAAEKLCAALRNGRDWISQYDKTVSALKGDNP